MGHAYRSEYRHLVAARLAELRRTRHAVDPLLKPLEAIRARRVGRAAAGAVGIAGAATMVMFTCAGEDDATPKVLLATWAAMLVTWLSSRTIAKLTTKIRVGQRVLELTGRLDEDLARIEAAEPARELEGQVDRHELASTALPLAAFSLLTPLTLHMCVLPFFNHVALKDYGWWIRVSLMLVGHAHLALMAMSVSFARRMKHLSRDQIIEMNVTREWGKALGIAVAVASMPGIIFLMVPTLLSAFTGLVFIPAMFIGMRRTLIEERHAIEEADAESRLRIAVPNASIEELETLEADGWLDIGDGAVEDNRQPARP